MSLNYYSELHIHAVWHTIGNRPLLTPAIEMQVHAYFRQKCKETRGVIIRAIGGVADHVHIALTIPPTLTISDFVGRLKGGSSYEVNHTNPTKDKLLEWQTGYGVLSFGTKDIPWVVDYIQRQKEHHRYRKVFDRLERITDIESPMNGADAGVPPS